MCDWYPRAKYVDDLTAIEIIPRNAPSLLRYLVSEVQEFAYANNMQLNPAKCKVMSVNFLHYNSYQCLPVASGGVVLEHVSSFKLLGIYMAEKLTWAVHCDFMVKRSNRRLHALRSLRRCRVPPSDMIQFYKSLLRSILEYDYVVFSNLPLYLSDTIEKMQKRALKLFSYVIIQ